MKFKIDSKIFERFSGLVIGVVIGKNLDNAGEAVEIADEARKQEKRIRSGFETETLSQNPKIDIWRKAYSLFGGKPKDNKSSVESLYRLILRGTELKKINKLVDIYNFISLRYMFPVGGEDLERVKGDIVLTFAQENEPSVVLLGDNEARPPHPGEVIYKDGESAICRRWNWREANRTKLTEKTKNCVLVIEGLPPVKKEEIETATKELRELVQKHCRGNIEMAILDEKNPEVLVE